MQTKISAALEKLEEALVGDQQFHVLHMAELTMRRKRTRRVVLRLQPRISPKRMMQLPRERRRFVRAQSFKLHDRAMMPLYDTDDDPI